MAESGNFLEENKELQKAIYDDLGHESAKKFGIALADVIEWTMPWLYKIRLTNAKRKLIFEKHLKNLANEIGEIPEENVIEIQSEIIEPILEKLTCTTNENVAKLFINLLATAANDQTVGLAHPSFIEMISRMSADEAKILAYLKDIKQIPFLNIRVDYGSSFTYYYKRLTGLEDYAQCENPDNIFVYLDNLEILGILSYVRGEYLLAHTLYDNIIELYKPHYEDVKRQYEGNHVVKEVVQERGYYEITEFGQLFIKVCTKTNLPTVQAESN